VAVFLVGYDLDKPGQDYADLIAALKLYSNWWHCLDSTWIIVTNDSAEAVRNNLQRYIDQNDKILVAAIGAPGAWRGFDKECGNWLLTNLK